jgi:CHAT domain-containing protein
MATAGTWSRSALCTTDPPSPSSASRAAPSSASPAPRRRGCSSSAIRQWQRRRVGRSRRAESLAVADLFPPADRVVLLGAAAAENTVRELASGFTVLHFATHAVLDRTALANAVILAPGGAGEPSDGLLRVREVFALDLEADLVTLSACDSGGGQVSADGILGLSRAFFCAGAASVLVSLWSVADESARPQMEAFYAECARNGWNKAAALRRAQLETLRRLRGGEIRTRSGKPLSENPILWAPFALIGEAGWMEPAEE